MDSIKENSDPNLKIPTYDKYCIKCGINKSSTKTITCIIYYCFFFQEIIPENSNM